MLNVIICKGLPGSGKSTWAKKLIDDHPGQYKRINKDDLRAMLDNGKFSKQNEDFVLEVRNQILLMALQ
jgi:predicted kinase